MVDREGACDLAERDAASVQTCRLLTHGQRMAVASIFGAVEAFTILALVALRTSRGAAGLCLAMFTVAGRAHRRGGGLVDTEIHSQYLPLEPVCWKASVNDLNREEEVCFHG